VLFVALHVCEVNHTFVYYYFEVAKDIDNLLALFIFRLNHGPPQTSIHGWCSCRRRDGTLSQCLHLMHVSGFVNVIKKRSILPCQMLTLLGGYYTCIAPSSWDSTPDSSSM
jgi:hypothetical protein